MSSRLLRIALACLASGVLAGLLTASQCRDPETGCRIAALQALSSEPASWVLWLHWINWLPGAVFGLIFVVAARRPGSVVGTRNALIFTGAAAAAYFLAGLIFAGLLLPAHEEIMALSLWVWPSGLIAGLIGAYLLAVVSSRVIAAPVPSRSSPAGMWLPALVGAIAGVLFVWISTYGEQQVLLAWPAAFSLWQVSVGLALPPRITS